MTHLTLTVDRNPNATGVTLTAEVSGTLTNWDSGPAHTTLLEDTPARLRVRDNVPVNQATRRFLRLKAADP